MAGVDGSAFSQYATNEMVSDRPPGASPGWEGRFPGEARGAASIDARQVLADAEGARFVDGGRSAGSEDGESDRRGPRYGRIALVAAVVLGGALYWGVPYVREAWATVSTDDAFVSGHITNVSPRIADLVTEVLVDQNDRVEPGTPLVRLDRVPFELAVAESRAALKQAEAAVVEARALVRSRLEQARSSWHRRQNAQEELRRLAASLRSRVASLRARESSLELAEADRERIDNLVKRGSATQSELDVRNNTRDVARAQVKEAWAAVQEVRASLGLESDYADPLSIPESLERRQSNVQSISAETFGLLAEIGVPFDPRDIETSKSFDEFLRRGDLGAVDRIVENSPGVRTARAAAVRAERDLDLALLRLSYTEIRAEIAGRVEDRSVHPGDRVEPGETILSIRPDYVWIDANYKETQLRYIRIGMPVDLEVDAYPGRTFKGRVAGFSPGTGLAASLLPPQNATGNYVKVTQRLPVRIELVQRPPEDAPLFAGLSVVPKVRYTEPPTGPGAGRRLPDAAGRPAPPDVAAGPAGSRSGRSVEESPGR